LIDNFWKVPRHHPYSDTETLIKETANKLNVSSRDLKVFTKRFVELANDHIEEVMGFNSVPAHRACAALSELIEVEEAKKESA
jgi:hypothetical protein